MSIVAHKQLPIIHWVRVRKGANPKRFDEHVSALLERSFGADNKQPVTFVADKVTCRVDLQAAPPYIVTQEAAPGKAPPVPPPAAGGAAPTDDVVERRLQSMVDRPLLGGKSDLRYTQCACCSRAFGPLVRRRQCAFCTKVCCAGCVARGAVVSTTGATDLDACVGCCGAHVFHAFKHGGAQVGVSATSTPAPAAAAPSMSSSVSTAETKTSLSVFGKLFVDIPESLSRTTSEAFCARMIFCLSRLTRATFWEHPMCVEVRKLAVLFHCNDTEILELEGHSYTVMAKFLTVCRKCADRSVMILEALSGKSDEVATTAIVAGCIYATCISLPKARPLATQLNLALAIHRGFRDPRMSVEDANAFQRLSSLFVSAFEVLLESLTPERIFSLRPISNPLGDWKWSNDGTAEIPSATFGCFANIAMLTPEQMQFQSNRDSASWCSVQSFSSRSLEAFFACRSTMDDPGATAVLTRETRFILLASPPPRVALHLGLAGPWKVLRESTQTPPGPIDVLVSIHRATPLAEAFVRKYHVPRLTQQVTTADSDKTVTRLLSEWLQVWFYADAMPLKSVSAAQAAAAGGSGGGGGGAGSVKDSYTRPILLVTGPAGSGKSCAAMYVYAECMVSLHLERVVPLYLDPHKMRHAFQTEGGVDRYLARYLGISLSTLLEIANELPIVLVMDSVDESCLTDANFRTMLVQNPVVTKCRIMITCREGHLQIPATLAAVCSVIHVRMQPLSYAEGAALLASMARLPPLERPPVQISHPSWLTLPIHAKLLAMLIRENFPTSEITTIEELFESFVFLRHGRHRQRGRIVDLVVHMAQNHWRCSAQEAKRILGTNDTSTLVDGYVAMDPSTRSSDCCFAAARAAEPESEFALMHRSVGDYVLYSELVRRLQSQSEPSAYAVDMLSVPLPYTETVAAMYKASKHVTPRGTSLVDRVIAQRMAGWPHGRRRAPYIPPPSDFRSWCCAQSPAITTRRLRAVALTTLGKDFLRAGDFERAIKHLTDAKSIYESLWPVVTQRLLGGDATIEGGNVGIATSALHDEFAVVLAALASAHEAQGDWSSLLKIRECTVAIMEARYTAESAFVTPFLKALADTHRRLGNHFLYQQTLLRAIRSLELETYRNPNHNPCLAQALQDLGEHTQKRGGGGADGAESAGSGGGSDVLGTIDALRLLERCLRVKELTYYGGDLSAASPKYALVSCAVACNKLQKYEAARQYLERALAPTDDERSGVGSGVGLSPSETATALVTLGHALIGLQRYSEALRPYERALALVEAPDFPDNPPRSGGGEAKTTLLLAIFDGTSIANEGVGDIAGACKYREQFLELLTKDGTRGPGEPNGPLATSYSELASFYSRLGKYEEAVAKLKTWVQILSKNMAQRRDDVEATITRLVEKTPSNASGFVVLDMVSQLLLSIHERVTQGRELDTVEALFTEIINIAARVP